MSSECVNLVQRVELKKKPKKSWEIRNSKFGKIRVVSEFWKMALGFRIWGAKFGSIIEYSAIRLLINLELLSYFDLYFNIKERSEAASTKPHQRHRLKRRRIKRRNNVLLNFVLVSYYNFYFLWIEKEYKFGIFTCFFISIHLFIAFIA